VFDIGLFKKSSTRKHLHNIFNLLLSQSMDCILKIFVQQVMTKHQQIKQHCLFSLVIVGIAFLLHIAYPMVYPAAQKSTAWVLEMMYCRGWWE
jgi:hypothetical protein